MMPRRIPGALAHPWRHRTLRTRMMIAIAALALLGLVVSNVAGVLLLRRQLIRQVDDRLNAIGEIPPALRARRSPPPDILGQPPNSGLPIGILRLDEAGSRLTGGGS